MTTVAMRVYRAGMTLNQALWVYRTRVAALKAANALCGRMDEDSLERRYWLWLGIDNLDDALNHEDKHEILRVTGYVATELNF